MIKYQKNKYSMYVGVRAYLDDHSAGYENNEEFNEHLNSYKSVLQDIARKEDERSKATLGKVKNKARVRRSVTDQALAVSGAIYSFAKKSGDYVLMRSVDLQKTDFDRFRDAGLVIELNSIKNKAAQFSAEIARFGITAEKFTEFENKINEYVDALSAKNTGSATKQGASKTMVSFFRDADSLLDSIDRFMENYKISDKDFYDGYKAARVIKDLGIRHNGGIGINGAFPGNGSSGDSGDNINAGETNPQTAGLLTTGNTSGNDS
ncbi:MAG: hypothetical protein JSS91_07520 [Bacteroidetes bacterium]|nr:hypothetical protein [Bacteroidota bacterium]